MRIVFGLFVVVFYLFIFFFFGGGAKTPGRGEATINRISCLRKLKLFDLILLNY